MNRATDQALRSLLPTLNDGEPLPPQLADLAGSLLAQSRHRASALRAEEEVARAYACAHIACDRLKTVLNLPPIQPRPPVQPRLYRRLYAHLNATLQPAPVSGRAAVGRLADDAGSGSLQSPAGRRAAATPTGTPTRQAASRTGAPARPTPRKSAAQSAASASSASPFPPWLRPAVRYVCGELGHPQLAPTVVAGIAAIHREALDETKDRTKRSAAGKDGEVEDTLAWVEAHWTGLAAALYLYCVTSWRDPDSGESGGQLEEKQFQADEKGILAAFGKARESVQVPADLDDDASWAGWRDLRRRGFRDALVVVSDRQWLQSDWYRDVAQLRRRADRGEEEAEGVEDQREDEEGGQEDRDEDDNTDGIPTKVWRADSMLQARYDFLGDAKQRAYEAWRGALLAQLDAAEGQAQPQPQPMEVDS